jgi:hypothetical protein
MGTLNQPGAFDCLKNLKPDEPYFLLRGQDLLAPAIVRRWAAHAAEAGVNPAKVAEAERIAYDMERYQDRKVPD